MSWSHNEAGPALEVARKVELDSEQVQKNLKDDERALHARVVSLIIVACHSMKDKHVRVAASGHASGPYVDGIWTPNEHTVNVTINPFVPVESTEPLMLQEPVAEPVPEAAPVEEPVAAKKKKGK